MRLTFELGQTLVVVGTTRANAGETIDEERLTLSRQILDVVPTTATGWPATAARRLRRLVVRGAESASDDEETASRHRTPTRVSHWPVISSSRTS